MVQQIYPLRSLALKYAPVVMGFGANHHEPLKQIQKVTVGDREISLRVIYTDELPVKAVENDMTTLLAQLPRGKSLLVGKGTLTPGLENHFLDELVHDKQIVSAVCVHHDRISRTHMMITHEEDGTYTVTDLESKYGTMVGRKKLKPTLTTIAPPGNWIEDVSELIVIKIPGSRK